jgi:hypothetical protein
MLLSKKDSSPGPLSITYRKIRLFVQVFSRRNAS